LGPIFIDKDNKGNDAMGFMTRVARFFLVHDAKKVKNVPNEHKMSQVVIKYPEWAFNIPGGLKIYQHFQSQGPPKFTQSGIFGLKINHLATLHDQIGRIF
jgi:hypothetical protein